MRRFAAVNFLINAVVVLSVGAVGLHGLQGNPGTGGHVDGGEVTLPTNGHVLLGSADNFDLFVLANSFRIGAFSEATHAHRMQLDDVLRQRHQVDHVCEAFALEGPVQRRHDDRLAEVGDTLAISYNVGEELPLVDADDVVVVQVQVDVVKGVAARHGL